MSVCVCVKGSGVHKERQKESRAGSRVKGGADPGGARGVAVAALGFPGRGCVEGGGDLMETSNVTKTDLTGRVNEAAVTERPCSLS